MSIIIMTAVWRESRSKGGARLVLLSLADQANDDGWCWPSVGTIADRCNISERAVQQHLRALEEAGELVRESRSGHSSRYRVVLTFGGADSSGVQNLRGAEKRQGGEAGFGGGVKPASPRTVREPSKNRQDGTRIPDGWEPTTSVVQSMQQECPAVDVVAETRKFRDYWRSATGRNATKRDWDATWRNWIRRANEDRPPRLRPVPAAVPDGIMVTPPATPREKLNW